MDNWELLLAGEIEIDHVVPKSHFKYESMEDPQFQKCWELKNLQPLWKQENKRKNNKLDWSRV